MDPIFASVLLSFFALIIALVSVTVAIAYRQNEIAQQALKNASTLNRAIYPNIEKTDENNDVQ
jgi:hypothetical protein